MTILSFTFLGAQTQKGKASFYARRATGSLTANGERLHHDSMTCAHLKYPFGTLLKVTNLANGRQVVVRVNDRGPYRKGRIIDLSVAAAKALGMITQGIASVTVEKVTTYSIPFKPEEDDNLEFPKKEFEIADIMTGITPIWQVEAMKPEIDHQQVRKSMENTGKKVSGDVSGR